MENEEFSFMNNIISNNDQNIYETFYSEYMNNSKIIVDYIEYNFKNCNKDNSIEKLNKLGKLLRLSGIDYSNNIYEYINNNTNLLIKCIEIIIENCNVEELNDTAMQFIESYYLNNDNIKFDTQITEYIDEDTDIQITTYYPNTVKEIRKIPLLSEEENLELIINYQKTKSKEYRDKIITHNLRLIIPIAYKYSKRWNIDVEDLLLEGTFGILRALEDYDPSKAKFSTYASNWISQKISRYIVDNKSNIRIPVNKYEKLVKYRKACNRLINKLGRIPTDKEVADELEISLDKIIEYKQLLTPIKSLNDTITVDSDEELIDFIPTGDMTPEEKSLNLNFDDLKNALDKLNEDQRNIICLRYGLYDGIPRTLDQVCKDLYKYGLKKNKLTGERARQIEVKALKILKSELSKNNNIKIEKPKQKYTDIYLDKKIELLINILKNTDSEIIEIIFKDIPNYYITLFYRYYDSNFNKKDKEIPYDTKVILVTQLLIKVSYERDKILNNVVKKNNMIVFPTNIYAYFDKKNNIEKTKEDVNRCINRLSAEKRYLLSQYYDIYYDTGALIKTDILESDKVKLNQIFKDIDFDLPTSKHKIYKQKKKI